MKAKHMDQDRYFAGVRMVSFDLVKELVIAVVVTGLLAMGLAFALSSPDVPSVTIKSWATADPVDFVTTATAELARTSDSALYGPPYNDGSDSVQAVGPISPQQWAGNAFHLDTAQEFVLGPLTIASGSNPDLAQALSAYNAATSDRQGTWLSAYSDALGSASVESGAVTVPAGDYGPVPTLMSNLLNMARSGSLDGILLTSPLFYQTNYSAPLLFIADGSYLSGLADQQHLSGDQWGAMNETGSYPGQTWLWLFSMLYQIPPFNTASNADLLVVMTMGLLTTLLALVPFIPGLRDIPRLIPVHRLIWRRKDS